MPTKEPRVVYGLHEKFVLFPYERGSRFARLVVRALDLHRLCKAGVRGRRPIPAGAPLILGELRESVMSQNMFVPVVIDGTKLNRMRSKAIEWQLRYYRVQPFAERSIRFEAGTKNVYATYTAYFSLELLEQVTREGLQGTEPAKRLPESG